MHALKGAAMDLFKDQPDPKEVFDNLIWEEKYAEAFKYAVDNNIERDALKICIGYIQEDDERTERELQESKQRHINFISAPKSNNKFFDLWCECRMDTTQMEIQPAWYEVVGNNNN